MDAALRAQRIAGEATAHAADIGVEMTVEWQVDQHRLTFMVERREGPPGSGERAIRRLLDLSDAADMEVAIDVLRSEPALIRYYWRFGFTMTGRGDAAERVELERVEAERSAYLARPGNRTADLPVTFMWRDASPGRTRLAA